MGKRLQKEKNKKGSGISFFIRGVFLEADTKTQERDFKSVGAEQKREEDFWEKHRGSGRGAIATKAIQVCFLLLLEFLPIFDLSVCSFLNI